jgi:hypothetical protein
VWIPIALCVALLLAGCGSAAGAEEPLGPPSPPALTAGDVQRIAVADARALVDEGQAVLLDTRSFDSYRTAHAAGAIAFPESEAAGRLGLLPAGKALIFY